MNLKQLLKIGRLVAGYSALLTLLLLFSVSSTLSQTKPSEPDARKQETATQETKAQDQKTKPPFTLVVKTKPILNFSLKAEKAKLSEIAEVLQTKLKTP